MNSMDLQDIINFAKSKKLMNVSVVEVIKSYEKDMKDYFMDYFADEQLAMEACM